MLFIDISGYGYWFCSFYLFFLFWSNCCNQLMYHSLRSVSMLLLLPFKFKDLVLDIYRRIAVQVFFQGIYQFWIRISWEISLMFPHFEFFVSISFFICMYQIGKGWTLKMFINKEIYTRSQHERNFIRNLSHSSWCVKWIIGYDLLLLSLCMSSGSVSGLWKRFVAITLWKFSEPLLWV